MELLEQYFTDKIEYYRSIYFDYFDKFKFTNILVRYAEIGLKSDKVRERMEKRLIDDGIKNLLKKRGIKFTKYTLEPGRIFFSFRNEDVKLGSFIILNTPGIKSISPVLKTDLNLEHITNKCVQYADSFGFKSNMSIGVKVKILKRSRFPNDDPKTISEKCSNKILLKFPFDKDGRINIANPDLKIFLEIRNQFSYIYSKKIYAFHQGLPVENERASIANMLGRFYDIDSWIRIMRRGQHIFPVFFETDDNSKLKEITDLCKLFKNFYPIDHFYAMKIDLLKVLKSLKSQLKDHEKKLICPLCRYFRLILLATINNRQKSILAPSLRIFHNEEGTSNLFKYQPPPKKKEQKHTRTLVRKKFRDFRGIIDGESLEGEIFCPLNEDLWKTTSWIPEPIMQPGLMHNRNDIIENLLNIVASSFILEELYHENKKNKNIEGNIDKKSTEFDQKIEELEYIKKLLIKNKPPHICSFKNSEFCYTPLNIDEFEKIQKRVGINTLVKNAVLKSEFIKIF
ncbi:MAG: hypothetical protein GY870_11065 [archaeon]|nr:hypothetical protein [archaeon]